MFALAPSGVDAVNRNPDAVSDTTTDPTAEIPLVDAQARHVITTELDKNVVVLAGAGAGKTHVLIGRMVAAVETGRATVDQLAAITFTRKAAGEMKNRFADRLITELTNAKQRADDDAVGRLQIGLDNVDLCFIGTIHAFCARLLRERPLDAGLSPDFVELDEREESAARREAWDSFVEDVFMKRDPLIERFMETGLGLEDLFPFFQNRVNYAEVPLKPADVTIPELSGAVAVTREFVAHVGDHLPNVDDQDEAMKTIRRATYFIANRQLIEPPDQIDFLMLVYDGFARSSAIRHTKWGPHQAYAKKLKTELAPALIDHLDPLVTAWREYVYSVAAPLVDSAVDFFREYRRERSQVTFQDLMEYSVDMLKKTPSVRRYFARRIRTLFVDEFQDTDPLQAEMLLLLTSENVDEQDWRKCVPRPGTLFIVGDEKQSIYRFRRADIDIFRKVVEILRDHGGEVVELTTSFRSLGNLCGVINRVYRKLFDGTDATYQAAFAPLNPFKEAGDDDFCVRRLAITLNRKKESHAAEEADRIADFIQGAIEGKTEFNGDQPDSVLPPNAEPGSFMLISQRRMRLSVYAAALEKRGIPYDLTGGDSLGALEELRLLVAFFDVLLFPDDPVKYFGYLRGPLIGLSDPDLYAYKRAGGKFRITNSDMPEGLAPSAAEKIKQARSLLRTALDDLKRLPASAAIERIMDRLGLLPFAASKSNGSYRAGSLYRVLSFARMWDADGFNWVQIVKQFRDLITDDVKAVEGMTLNVGRTDVVRILNLHQAKGLEAPVVFLVDASDVERSPDLNDVHLSRVDGQPFVSIAISKSMGYSSKLLGQPPGWEADNFEEALYQRAEQTRLKYVAATRAMRLLVVGQVASTGKTTYLWDEMVEHLSDVPELKIPEVSAPDLPIRDPEPLAIQTHTRERAGKLARAASYEIRQVARHDGLFGRPVESDDKLGASEILVDDSTLDTDAGLSAASQLAGTEQSYTRGGRGMQFGLIVHQLFQDLIEGHLVETEGYLEALFVTFEGSDNARDEATAAAKEALDQFRHSDLFADLQEADAVYSEVPFASVSRGVAGDARPRQEVIPPDGNPLGDIDVVTSGVIDLIYRKDDSWHVVDYKTDGAMDEAEVAVLVRRYSQQVRTYATEWSSIVRQPVISAGLWVVARSEYVGIELE